VERAVAESVLAAISDEFVHSHHGAINSIGVAVKKVLPALVLTAAAVLAMPATAQAAARPTWASSGLSGVQASGSYSRTGNSVHFYGRLYDTSADKRSVGLYVSFTGESSYHYIGDKSGANTSVAIDLSSTKAPHLKVMEVKYTSNNVESAGPWVTIY
jgi:hypothetical protein